MPNEINPITNRSTCVAQTDLVSKFENIKESEIFDWLALYCQDKPIFIRELLTEQTYVAIKRFEDKTIRPLPDIHFYFPVKNLDSPPYFLFLLLTKYNKSENRLVLHNFSEKFYQTSEFISALENTGFCQERLFKRSYINDLYLEPHNFCMSIIDYAEKIHSDKLEMMGYILSMEIFLSITDHESNFFDSLLLKIDTKRMAEKGYFYHLFRTSNMFDVFEDKKFRDFAISSSSQAEFNFIFGVDHSSAVSVQKKDNKLSFIVMDSYYTREVITIKSFEDYYIIINENKSGNVKKELPNILMNTSNFKIITLNFNTQASNKGCLIFARDAIISLMKEKELLNKFHQYGAYGESCFFGIGGKISVTDIAHPSLVRFSQISVVTGEYKKSFDKKGLLDMNVRKNKSNEPQTLEQYLAGHSRNEEVFNTNTDEVETKYRNKAYVDQRKKLMMANSDYWSAKLNIDNKAVRSYLE